MAFGPAYVAKMMNQKGGLRPDEQVPVQIGDLLSFFHTENGGYMHAEGFIDRDLCLNCDAEVGGSEFLESVFRLVPKYKYDAQNFLKNLSWESSSGGNPQRLDSEGLEEAKQQFNLTPYQQAAEAEKHENQSEFLRMLSKQVTYGQVVQLQHVKSGKFVTMTVKEMASLEKHCLKVVVEEQGDEGSWFVITPRYKYRSEGEPVMMGDEIILFSKHFNNYLHCSSGRFPDRRHEVNGSNGIDGASFRALPFAPYEQGDTKLLKVGDIIRIFHKEVEGFLTNERMTNEDKSEQVFFHSPLDSDRRNSNTLWRLEGERNVRGGSLRFDQMFRLRHVNTGLFLAVRKTKSSQSFYTCPGDSDVDNLLFTLISVDPLPEAVEQPIITYDHYVCLYHPATGTFLHVPQFLAKNRSLNLSLSDECSTLMGGRMTAIDGNKDRHSEDALAVHLVAPEEVEHVYYTKSQISCLRKHVTKLQNGDRADFTQSQLQAKTDLRALQARKAVSVLIDLIKSCSISSDENPYTREGIPVIKQQNLLCELNVVEVIMNLLQFTFQGVLLSELRQPIHYTSGIIVRLSYRLMKQLVVGNKNNRRWLSSQSNIQFILKHIVFAEATATLMELYIDNRVLLELVSHLDVAFFINSMKEKRFNASYAKFLSILCVCEDEGLKKNQELVCEKLLIENPSLILPLRLREGSEVEICQGQEESSKWIPLSSFMRETGPLIREYFLTTIHLLANLCKGGNERTIPVISKMISYEIVCYCVTENYHPNLRRAFCELLMNAFVDVAPHKAISLINLTRVWSTLSESTSRLETSVELNPSYDYSILKRFVMRYIKNCTLTNIEEIEKNHLTLQVLVLLRKIFSFGFFYNLEEMTELSLPLVKLLGGRSRSEPVPKRGLSFSLKEPPSSSERYEKNDRTWMLMESKLEICRILDMMCDIRLDLRLTEVLCIYKTKYQEIDTDHDEEDHEEEGGVNELPKESPSFIPSKIPMKRESARRMESKQRIRHFSKRRIARRVASFIPTAKNVELRINKVFRLLDLNRRLRKSCNLSRSSSTDLSVEKFGAIESDSDEFGIELTPILLDLLHHQYSELTAAAAQLLIRQYYQREEVKNALSKVQILISSANVKTYEKAKDQVDELTRISSFKGAATDKRLGQEEVRKIKSLLSGLTDLCFSNRENLENNAEHQRILANVHAHEAAVELLRLPESRFKDVPDIELDNGMSLEDQINTHCFLFFSAFCRNHPGNQANLFKYLDLFMQFLTFDQCVGVCLKQIFSNNRPLCSQVTETQVRAIINVIAEGFKYPHFIDILETFCVQDGVPLRRNQKLVLKMLLEKQRDALVLFKDQESQEHRKRLIQNEDYQNPNSLLHFHMRQIDLITTCAKGKIYESETMCQSLFSLQDISQQLHDDSNLLAIKCHFIQLLDEVYFETEKKVDYLLEDFQIWKVFNYMQWQLKLLSSALTEKVAPHPEFVDYNMNYILPFLLRFFEKHMEKLTSANIHAEAKKICEALMDTAYSLLTHSNVDLLCDDESSRSDHLAQIVRLMKAMKSREIFGKFHKDKIDGAIKASEKIHSVKAEKKEVQLRHKILNQVSREEKVVTGIRGFAHFFSPCFSGIKEQATLAREFAGCLGTSLPKLVEVLHQHENLKMSLVTLTLQALGNILEAKLKEEEEAQNEIENQSDDEDSEDQEESESQDPGVAVSPSLVSRLSSLSDLSLEQLQGQLNEIGLTELLLRLIESGKSDYVKASLDVGVLMLHGGNNQVQDTIYADWESNKGDEQFFWEVRRRIRIAMGEIKERQDWQQRMKSLRQQKQLAKAAATPIATSVQSFTDELAQVSFDLAPPSDRDQSNESGNGDNDAILTRDILEFDDEADQPFPEEGYICPLLRFLQLLCEGHNLRMQNYLRSQVNNVKSYDLISETAAYLESLEREIDYVNVNTAIQLFTTLAEYCQGPCAENQFALIRTKLCDSVNWIIKQDYKKTCGTMEESNLKGVAMTCMLSLLEGVTTPSIPRQMIHTLDFQEISDNIDDIFLQDEDNRNNELAFQYYHLMTALGDYDDKGLIAPFLKPLENLDETIDPRGVLSKGTGRIEIVRDDRLERIYFKIPKVCWNLTNQSREALMWNVKRENQQEKIQDFFQQSDFLMKEMHLRADLSREKTFSWLAAHESKFQAISFTIAMLINIVVIVTFVAPQEDEDGVSIWDSGWEYGIHPTVYYFIMVAGLLQVACSTLTFFIYRRFHEPIILRRSWRERCPDDDFEDLERNLMYHLLSYFFLLKDPMLLHNILRVVFAVCGVCLSSWTSPFFFSYHLFDVVSMNKVLQNVLKAVTQNGVGILTTVALAVVIVYIYAIFGFVFFRDKFLGDDDELLCETMLMCLVNFINLGTRNGGGIGDVMVPPKWSDPDSSFRILYDSTFFFIIIVILLNIIFGIIIDTFGELREESKEILDDMENVCFTCGIDRSTFDRSSKATFEEHIKKDHYIWFYLYFIVYLLEKDETEYTGPEQYVRETYDQKDNSFVPNLRALCLDPPEDGEAMKTQVIMENVQILKDNTDRNMKLLTKNLNSTNENLYSQLIKNKDQFHKLVTQINAENNDRIDKVEQRITQLDNCVLRILDMMETAERLREYAKEKEAKKKKVMRERRLKAMKEGGAENLANLNLGFDDSSGLGSSAESSDAHSEKKETKMEQIDEHGNVVVLVADERYIGVKSDGEEDKNLFGEKSEGEGDDGPVIDLDMIFAKADPAPVQKAAVPTPANIAPVDQFKQYAAFKSSEEECDIFKSDSEDLSFADPIVDAPQFFGDEEQEVRPVQAGAFVVTGASMKVDVESEPEFVKEERRKEEERKAAVENPEAEEPKDEENESSNDSEPEFLKQDREREKMIQARDEGAPSVTAPPPLPSSSDSGSEPEFLKQDREREKMLQARDEGAPSVTAPPPLSSSGDSEPEFLKQDRERDKMIQARSESSSATAPPPLPSSSDSGSEPEFLKQDREREKMLQARDEGAPSATAPPPLSSSSDSEPEFLKQDREREKMLQARSESSATAPPPLSSSSGSEPEFLKQDREREKMAQRALSGIPQGEKEKVAASKDDQKTEKQSLPSPLSDSDSEPEFLEHAGQSSKDGGSDNKTRERNFDFGGSDSEPESPKAEKKDGFNFGGSDSEPESPKATEKKDDFNFGGSDSEPESPKVESKKESPKTTTRDFNFRGSDSEPDSPKASKAATRDFNFGGSDSEPESPKAPPKESPKEENKKDDFNFGGSDSEPESPKEENKKDDFNFGGSDSEPESPKAPSKESPKEENKKDDFEFGGSDSEPESPKASPKESPKEENKKDDFNFGGSDSEPESPKASPKESPKEENKKDDFFFGGSDSEPESPKAPSKESPKEENKKDEFNFGGSDSEPESPKASPKDSPKEENKKDDFAFGGSDSEPESPKAENKKEESPKAATRDFNFGGSDSEPESPKASPKEENKKDDFEFGGSDSEPESPKEENKKDDFNFGGSDSEPESPKVENKKEESPKAASRDFNFGGSDSEPESPKAPPKESPKEENKKDDFNFGGSDSEPESPKASKESPKAATRDFNFGGSDSEPESPKASPKASPKESPKEENKKDDFEFGGSDSEPESPKAENKKEESPKAATRDFNFGGSDSEPESPKASPKESPKEENKKDDFNFGGSDSEPESPKASPKESPKEENKKDEFNFGGSDSEPESPKASPKDSPKEENKKDDFNFGGSDSEPESPKASPKEPPKEENKKDDFNFGGSDSEPESPKASKESPKAATRDFNFGGSDSEPESPKASPKASPKDSPKEENKKDDFEFGGSDSEPESPKVSLKEENKKDDFEFGGSDSEPESPKASPKEEKKKDDFEFGGSDSEPESPKASPKESPKEEKKKDDFEFGGSESEPESPKDSPKEESKKDDFEFGGSESEPESPKASPKEEKKKDDFEFGGSESEPESPKGSPKEEKKKDDFEFGGSESEPESPKGSPKEEKKKDDFEFGGSESEPESPKGSPKEEKKKDDFEFGGSESEPESPKEEKKKDDFEFGGSESEPDSP